MNKKMILYILLASASLQPFISNATEVEIIQVIATSNQTEPDGFDELDIIYQEQGGNNEHMVSHAQMPEWVVSLGLAVILKYLAVKDFMTNSWDKLKQTIARK